MSLDPRKLATRDPSAARALLNLLRHYLRRYVRRSSWLRDLVQSAAAEMLARLHDQPQTSTPQIVRWTSYSATNALRRELRRLRHETVAYESQLHSQARPDLEAIAAAREELERIDRLLTRFRERDRRILLAKLRGHTDVEIAAQLKTTRGAVRSSALRTRKALRLSLTIEERERLLQRMVKLIEQSHASPLGAGSSSSRTTSLISNTTWLAYSWIE